VIEATKRAWFEALFDLYNHRLLKKHFHTIYLSSSSAIPLPSQAVFCINHSSWWDALVLFHLNRHVLHKDLYVMMHEKGLTEYPFFRKLGAFSVNRDKPRDIIRSLSYSGKLLQEGKTVGLFPQGDEFHLEKRPLHFLPGSISLIEKYKQIPLLPICFYYSFGHVKKPEVYIHIGEPIYYDQLQGNERKDKNTALERMYTLQLDKLRELVINEKVDSFHPIL